ncbi:MAG: hypothetical protein G01um101416_375 [Microgenomates group bacterium Gr01-1014_16]|nr:MAG: hypothetical protein G01um101416_375 [Microgenomates group bacterium Gr01-1014_16]
MQKLWALLASLIFGTSAGFSPLPTPTPTPNPYSIDYLSNRSYESKIKVEQTVRTTGGFSSYVISFDSDGLKEYALMNLPAGKQPEKGWPTIIVNHGYIDPEVYSTKNSYINTSAYFANAGFLVLKPDYRGHDQSEGDAGSLIARISYAVDVLNLISAAKKLDTVDPDRIYMYGHSMGGDVTLRVIEVCPMCVQAASLWAPAVRDWPESYLYFSRRNTDDPRRKERMERFQKELTELFTPADYPGISALDNINFVQIPVNIHHGTADQSVPYEWGQTIAAQFEAQNKTVHFYSYQGDSHDIPSNWSTALNRDIDLFN